MAISRWVVNSSPLIDRAEPVIRRLQDTGLHVSDQIVQRLLHEVGESPGGGAA